MEIQNREIKFMISIKCTFLISCWHNVHVFCRKSYCSIFFREIVIRKSGGGKFWKCVNEQRTSCWLVGCCFAWKLENSRGNACFDDNRNLQANVCEKYGFVIILHLWSEVFFSSENEHTKN